MLGLLVAAGSALLCAFAAYIGNFWLLCAATAIAGYYSANGQLYRFASAELAAPGAREKAVSLVMAVLARIEFPEVAQRASANGGRPLSVIARQPAFIVATGAGALGYGVMNLLMAATPLAMQHHGLPFADAAFVLEWHVIGMFAPGFFTGHLIKRFGVLPIMGWGAALNLVCIGVALSGVELHHFTVSLFLLGVGWNFLFTGSTTLSLSTYTVEEKDRAQAAMNFCVFAVMAVTSLTSGMLVTTRGWTVLNVGSLVPMLMICVGLAWLAWRKAPSRAAVG